MLAGWIIFLIVLFLCVLHIININSYFGNFYYNFPLIMLFVARSLDRITGGNITVANAYLADISTDINKAKLWQIINII